VPLKPHKKQLIFWLAGLLAMQVVVGQNKFAASSLSIKPTTDFDQRFYYTPGETQNVWGYRIGALINDKYKLGIGGYYMNKTDLVGIPSSSLTRTAADPYIQNKKLYLGTVYYEPYLLRRNLWETSLVFETGYGRTAHSKVDEKDYQTIQSKNALFIPLGAGLSVNLKLPALFHLQCFRWIGLNAMAGYRTTIYRGDKEFNYNGAYWSLSGAIFLDRMVEDFHSWKKERAIAREKRVIELHY